jgi:hypothetical protein
LTEAEIVSRISFYRDELRLGGWDIRYDPHWSEKDGKDATALTRISPQYRVAKVRIDPEVSGANIDFHIVHELMHLVLWEFQQMLGQVAAKSGPGGQAIIDLMDVEVERIASQVAHALTGVVFESVGKKDRKAFAPWVA